MRNTAIFHIEIAEDYQVLYATAKNFLNGKMILHPVKKYDSFPIHDIVLTGKDMPEHHNAFYHTDWIQVKDDNVRHRLVAFLVFTMMALRLRYSGNQTDRWCISMIMEEILKASPLGNEAMFAAAERKADEFLAGEKVRD